MFLEALKSEQKEIFNKLKYFPEFYLVGGTALALQIGHRISVDFDLFSEKEISPKLLNKVKKIFKGFKIEIVINHSEQLSVNVNPVRDYKDKEKIKREQISNEVNKMKIDFVKYNFSPLLALPKFEGVKFLSVQEIAAAKAYTLGRRITFK
ncbi:MAG: nucleotidyl transferase AbiEii/AbiGii toxin family protein, partial [bacterium]|nr:nucleotidyl transferase AbiEii/AbiGii toxin family protein [bacterium]